MSTATDGPGDPSRDPTDLPEFDLDYWLDDDEDPTELTVFSPAEGDISTHWITIDFDAAIPVHAMR